MCTEKWLDGLPTQSVCWTAFELPVACNRPLWFRLKVSGPTRIGDHLCLQQYDFSWGGSGLLFVVGENKKSRTRLFFIFLLIKRLLLFVSQQAQRLIFLTAWRTIGQVFFLLCKKDAFEMRRSPILTGGEPWLSALGRNSTPKQFHTYAGGPRKILFLILSNYHNTRILFFWQK